MTLEQELLTDPHGGSGLKMGGNKEQGKGTGFPNGLPMYPTGNNGDKRMLNEPMIFAHHPGFFRKTAKDPRRAEPPLGTNGLTEENISEMVRRLEDALSLSLFQQTGWPCVSQSACLWQIEHFYIALELSCV